MLNLQKSTRFLSCFALGAGLLAAAGSEASAAPIYIDDVAFLDGTSVSFSIGGTGGVSTFTLAGTGDIFNPVSIQTAGNGEVSAFGGFLGIPISPTTDFIDRGTVTYGPTDQFAAFPTTTTIPYSTGGNFLGLSFGLADGIHYGFAEFVDDQLLGYGFETAPGTAITAVALPVDVPEPASLALLGIGLLGAGAARRLGRVGQS